MCSPIIIEERVCVGLRKIFPLSMEVYFCDFGFDIIILRPVTKKCVCAKVSIIAHPFELMKYFLPQVDRLLSTYTLTAPTVC